MLAERVKQWPQQWKNEGLREGLEQGLERGLERGIEQGRQLGLYRALKVQLEQKFGPLSPSQEARLDGASEGRLLVWLQRLLTADSVDQVLAD